MQMPGSKTKKISYVVKLVEETIDFLWDLNYQLFFLFWSFELILEQSSQTSNPHLHGCCKDKLDQGSLGELLIGQQSCKQKQKIEVNFTT